LQQRGVTAERSWSSFYVFIPAENPDAKALALEEQVSRPQIDIIPSISTSGVWVMGAYYQLEAILPRLRCDAMSD
jgi:hypothetical protein